MEACLQQRRHFSHFLIFVDGMMGTETEATLKRLVSCLAIKWWQTYLKMCSYVQSRFEIALV